MITVHEAPYDDPVAVELVAEMHLDIEERYADDDDPTAGDPVATLPDVTPLLVRRPLGVFLVAHLAVAHLADAHRADRPAGCGALKPLAGAGGVGEIKRMYTRPDARRRGVSRVILTRLEEVAAELAYSWVQLETGLRQPEAIALYESAGWARIEPYGRYRDDPLSVCFGKAIPPR